MTCSCKQEWRIRYSGAGRLHRNTQWVQFAECASSAPFSSMEPNNCGRSGHRSKWSSLCGWFCSDDSGWLIIDHAEDCRATSIARSVNRNLKCLDNLKLLLHKASLVWNPWTCQHADTVGGCLDHWLVAPASLLWRQGAQAGARFSSCWSPGSFGKNGRIFNKKK